MGEFMFKDGCPFCGQAFIYTETHERKLIYAFQCTTIVKIYRDTLAYSEVRYQSDECAEFVINNKIKKL